MFSLMLHKLLHKKWMILCMLIGNILLIAVATSYPLYRVSSFDKMLTDEFKNYEIAENKYPAITSVVYSVMKNRGNIKFEAAKENAAMVDKSLRVKKIDTVIEYSLAAQDVLPFNVRDGKDRKRITVGSISDLDKHIEMLYGKLPADEVNSEGFIEVIVSDAAVLEQNILLGDEFSFNLVDKMAENSLRIKVVGIFKIKDESDIYWSSIENEVSQQVFMSDGLFVDKFLQDGKESRYNIKCKWNYIWDYETLENGQVNEMLSTINKLNRAENLKNKIEESGYAQILREFSVKSKRVQATLLILQVPVLLLLAAFLFMLSDQMLQMERNEISLLRSRGASRLQIILLYLMQSVFIGFISLIAGLPMGALFCKLLGSSTAFLEFSAGRSLEIKFTLEAIEFALFAVCLSIVMTIIPVISYSNVSIVNLKQKRSRQNKSLWKKLYLDIIFLGISFYGFFSFRRNSQNLAKEVLQGYNLDPLLYLSFSLFILGAGLLCVRIQPWFLKGIFAIGKRIFSPATYASILGTIRTGAKQEFIIVFLILTVAIGISDTVIARTIVQNSINNTRYMHGADIVLKERWPNNRLAVVRDSSLKLTYYEPDFDKFKTIPNVEGITQVLIDDDARLIDSSKDRITVMGIMSKGFYDVSFMRAGLLPYSFAEYLNVLAVDSQAILVSENFMTKKGMHLDDIILYENSDGKKAVGRIYGFFNYWPTYTDVSYELQDNSEINTRDEFLIVANLSNLKKEWGAYPYEVWMSVNDKGEGFYSWMENNNDIELVKFKDMYMNEAKIVKEPMFQGTNGILSMSFIVIIILCCVGYLIYWILSIKSRELLFGVLRAMGMRKVEVIWMLVIEQICSGVYAIVFGGIIGVFASVMFVPMIQKAYAASEQVLPLELISQANDMLQLFSIIAIMLVICLLVLGRLISKMNISSALKLGED